ncbi:Metallopeptidase M24 family protein isoform 2 [Hibiscus syriacus]|uniref:Metallopeptidase M24 family protein isoform 2 n=1 Tax=Hibiscus syriacus TaxID=106335 RepID=A0A6A3ARD5_HIBSY|nr:xaa-Pro dipeptidase-like [Hibiscus syriacus]KAE8706816.1 Metallopeptidase M24 family protein isoform 2 [Hibiscus syriacus]
MASTLATSLSPPPVPMELQVSNRQKLLNSIRQHLSDASRPHHDFVLLQGGEEKTRYCTDHLELFRLPADYAVWMGEIKPVSYFQERYMVSMVNYTDEIAQVLVDQYKGSGKPLLFLLHGVNTDSNNFSKPTEFEGIEKFETDLTTLLPILTECRVCKSDLELALIQFANDISSEAHVEVMRKTKLGMKEHQLESMFLRHTYMYGNGRHCSYTCICATGENNSALHYGHDAAPNDRILEDGDMAMHLR